MKQKKNSRAKKVLLMGISCVLVAALSVSFTLAYLTAKTNDKDNKFTASPGIDGEVIEPDYDLTMAQNWKPGDTIPKNPMVDNDTTHADVWVGASIEYQLSADGTNYKTVDPATFSDYVTVNNKPGLAWVDISNQATANTDKEYYFYNKKLLKQGTESTLETSYATDNNGVQTCLGSTGNVTTDNSTPLFSSVRPSTDLDISPDYSASYKPYYDSTHPKTLITATNAIPVRANATTPVPVNQYCFNNFKFRIKINGYGVMDAIDISQPSDTTLSGTTLADVEDAILKGLGGKTA